MIKNFDNSMPGVSSQQISKLESILDGELPKDYVNYLKEYGFVSINGRDLYGLGHEKFFNTLKKTLELQQNFNLSKYFVVIENLGIGGIYIMLNTYNGSIYEWSINGIEKKIYKSFETFLENEF